jgi:hypothetical protein
VRVDDVPRMLGAFGLAIRRSVLCFDLARASAQAGEGRDWEVIQCLWTPTADRLAVADVLVKAQRPRREFAAAEGSAIPLQ